MSTKFTDQAIAYLKAALPKDGPPSVVLSQADSPIVRQYSDGLCICYVVDDGKSYHYVQQRHLTQDGISEDELHAIGLRNLIGVVSKRDLRVQPYQSIFAVMMGGDFEASLILLDQIWEQHFRQFVTGEYAISIPARDVLAFCDTSSEQGVRELHQLVDRITPNGDHLISSQLYVRRDGRFIPRAA
jgi:uncharacterized protein YtpQ (UPF0354 family)